MFIDMRVTEGDYEGLKRELSEAGFRDVDAGRMKWNEKYGGTTVYVLPPQSQVEIFFGSEGVTDRVDEKTVTPEAREALTIALRYVKCERVIDHTGKDVDYAALLR